MDAAALTMNGLFTSLNRKKTPQPLQTHVGAGESNDDGIHHHHHHLHHHSQAQPDWDAADGLNGDDNDVSDSNEEEDGDIDDEVKKLQKLPTADRIQELFTNFKSFKFVSVLPRNLEYIEQEADKALGKTIRKIFDDDTICDKADLVAALQAVIATDSILNPNAAKKQNKQEVKTKEKNQKQIVKSFFPFLISLMNVILSRCDSEAPKSKADAQMNHIVLNSWRNVLSELNEIFAVFIHGKEAGKFDLGKVDTKLTHIVNQRNKMISYLTSHILEIEKEKLTQEQELNERDKQFAEIRAKYANMASRQKVLEADLNSQRTALATLTSETKMCEEIDKKIEASANSA